MSDDIKHPDRRKFLTVLGATGGGALALSGCSTSRVEKLIPYLVQSEDQVPGVPTYYASTCTECASACGVHVKTREGRAIKLEGNPEHPLNRGKLCARGQASLQGLYNPGRVKGPMLRTGGTLKAITWDEAITRLASEVQKAGSRLAAISGAGRGTFSDLLAEWVGAAGGRVTRYEPFDHEPMRLANQQVFGTDQLPAHDFGKAKYIVSFGADFLDTWLSPMENQRGFAESHGFANGRMSKHVYFGPRMSLTGLNADEWHPIVPGTEAVLALAMANVLAGANGNAGTLGGALAAYTPEVAARETGLPAATIIRLAHEFAAARPSLAVAGGVAAQHRNAVEVCVAVNVLNAVAGNIGETVLFGADLPAADGYQGMAGLMAAMDAGQVGLLLVHEANPAFTLPRSTGFVDRMKKVPFKVSTSHFHDETTALCDLLIPNLHAFERWDDARPAAGVYSLMQPVMEPVFATMGVVPKATHTGMAGTWTDAPATVGVSTGDVLLRTAQKVGGAFAPLTAPTFEAYLKTAWQGLAADHGGAADFDAFWRQALARGGVFAERPASAAPALAAGLTSLSYTKPALEGNGEFVFLPYPHSFLYDGRGANRPWLLENPDPVTKITWDSWVEVSPSVARALDVERGEMIRLVSPHGSIEAPVWIYEGLRDGVIAMPIGFGHTDFGQYATGHGANALDLLGAPGSSPFVPYLSTRVKVEKLNTWKAVATTEGTPRQLGRGIAEAMPLAAAVKGLTVRESYLDASGKPEGEAHTATEVAAIRGWRQDQIEMRKLGDYAVAQPSWGMSIDLAKCTGCSACVTACYAENNIPTVGYDEVLRGREMSWMRIERYWEGGGDTEQPLQARFVPMLCQHCENAPCEPVCPVYAAYHTADGLNGQVYNRCVGTRYCSNNCPYKVRYFNWYKYNETAFPEPLNLQLNPDVTVRARGVMEKCTMCVQRIRRAQHEARLEDRTLRDGEFTTACAQSCPSDAIVFGDMRNPESRVARIRQDPRGYHILEEVNTRPAITYLARVLHGAEA
jgi:anaerobic selenocysteine-containing dehydrogenase/Fe-S-cluster-containing dehydrogenase component